jgi:hypothetical protein
MTFCKLLLLTLLTLTALTSQAGDLIVVANTDRSDISMQKRQVRDVFMGNNSEFQLKPIAMTPNSETRFIFNTKIVGLTESRIQSYWAQMRFSGRKKPPQEFDTIESLLAFLQKNKETVAYLPADTKLPKDLKIIYQTN